MICQGVEAIEGFVEKLREVPCTPLVKAGGVFDKEDPTVSIIGEPAHPTSALLSIENCSPPHSLETKALQVLSQTVKDVGLDVGKLLNIKHTMVSMQDSSMLILRIYNYASQFRHVSAGDHLPDAIDSSWEWFVQ